jgi:hypothetical protein
MSVPVPPVPADVVLLAYLLFAAATVAFAVQERQFAASGRSLPLAAVANIVSAIASYNFAYLLVDDLFAVILIATAVHSLQYHMLCFVRNQRKFGDHVAVAQSGRARILATLSQRRRLPRLAAVLIGLGAVCASMEPFAYGIPLTLVLHHFYLDGVIWKGVRNPALARDLGLANGPRQAARAAS